MRQNAVSSAPQNEVATHRLAMNAMIPTVVDEPRISRSADPQGGDERDDADGGGGVADLAQRLAQRGLGGGGEELLQVTEDGLLELGRREHLPGHEQRDERDREDREQEVVGDHPGEAGQVVLVGLLPEVLQGEPDRPHAHSMAVGGAVVARGEAGTVPEARAPAFSRSDLRPWPD